MSAETPWITCYLFDSQGKQVGRCRVPLRPLAPDFIMWGNHHYKHFMMDGQYHQVHCYIVPLEHMHVPSEPDQRESVRKR